VILLALWLGKRSSQPASAPAEVHPADSGTTNPNASAVPSSAAPSANPNATSTGKAKGKVRKEISPEVSAGAQKTISGRLKVSIAVSVDASGNVSQTKFVSPGPSKYFARQAMAAAEQWKFDPPQINGQPVASEWTLRFQFGRTSTEVVPEETKP
jgi:TonB family protein